MVGGIIVLGMRLFYVTIGLVGLAMAASGYPPSGSGPPVLLLVGVGLVVGVLRPKAALRGPESVD